MNYTHIHTPIYIYIFYIRSFRKATVHHKDNELPFSFAWNHSVNYIVSLSTHQQHQHCCHLGTEKVFKEHTRRWPSCSVSCWSMVGPPHQSLTGLRSHCSGHNRARARLPNGCYVISRSVVTTQWRSTMRTWHFHWLFCGIFCVVLVIDSPSHSWICW